MPSVLIKRRLYKKNSDSKNAHWHPKQKINAVLEYMQVGNLSLAGRNIGVPEDTMRKWKAQSWWKEAEKEIKDQQKIGLSNKLDGIITKSLSTVEDRLDNGDFVYDPKSGGIKRIGIKAHVANQISKDMMDKQLVLEKAINNKPEEEANSNARLQGLLDEFLKFSKSKTIKDIPHETIATEVKTILVEQEGESQYPNTSTKV